MDNKGLFNTTSNITDLFTFDLSTFFFEDDFEEINCHEESEVTMVEYEKAFPWTELMLFNRVILRVFNHKSNILGSSHINIKLPAEPVLVNHKTLSELVNTLYRIYGWDDDSKGEWNHQDAVNYARNTFARIWTLGEGHYIYTVKIDQEKNGEITLQILFFNHLLKLINRTISFPINEFGS